MAIRAGSSRVSSRPKPGTVSGASEEDRSRPPGLDSIPRDSLPTIVFEKLRIALMEGQFWPGHRFKIRELAASLDMSETPVREALMQLVRMRALELHAAKSISVAHMTAQQYLELRSIRLALEGMAAEAATHLISNRRIDELAAMHDDLRKAEAEQRWADAVRANWQFHHSLYEAGEMPELLAILDTIWLRNGPLLNFLYPYAHPAYDGRHQHLAVLDYLRQRDAPMVRESIKADMIEGGRALVNLLRRHGSTRELVRERE